jgi:hypothetical protein
VLVTSRLFATCPFLRASCSFFGVGCSVLSPLSSFCAMRVPLVSEVSMVERTGFPQRRLS